ncbi:MAG TPA: ferrochelatase [Planctomycetes bacterium]|nr:ferrochelatase [Planctomycetota bacterium]
MAASYDAFLLISFGGPDRGEDVVPFLENVTRDKRVSAERLREVAEHYYHFGGISPLNEENRALLRAVIQELNTHGPQLPAYWGNRYWHPLLVDTVRQMAEDGIRRAVAFVTSAFGSHAGCRQYLEAIQRARQAVGAGAPEIDKLRLFYNHPGFVEAMADRVQEALGQIPERRREASRLVYTAHSLPVAMASRCEYVDQLREACRLVSERVGRAQWDLAFQSRGGPPDQAWLEPEVGQQLFQLARCGVADVVVVPIGFLAEHIEVLYDLDVEAAGLCDQLGLNMVRCRTVGAHPCFVRMIRQLIVERISDDPTRLALGARGPAPDVCPPGCCPSVRPAM